MPLPWVPAPRTKKTRKKPSRAIPPQHLRCSECGGVAWVPAGLILLRKRQR